MDIPESSWRHFAKGDNFCKQEGDGSLETFQKWGLLLNERIAPRGNTFLLKVVTNRKGGKYFPLRRRKISFLRTPNFRSCASKETGQDLCSLTMYFVTASDFASGQRGPRSDCADAQSYLGPRCPHIRLSPFIMTWLKYWMCESQRAWPVLQGGIFRALAELFLITVCI